MRFYAGHGLRAGDQAERIIIFNLRHLRLLVNEEPGVAASQLKLALSNVLPRLQEAVPEYSRHSHLFRNNRNVERMYSWLYITY